MKVQNICILIVNCLGLFNVLHILFVPLVYGIVKHVEEHQTLVEFGLGNMNQVCAEHQVCQERCQVSWIIWCAASVLYGLCLLETFANLIARDRVRKCRTKCLQTTKKRRFACATCLSVVGSWCSCLALWMFRDTCWDAVLDAEDLISPAFHPEYYVSWVVQTLVGLLGIVYLATAKWYQRSSPEDAQFGNEPIEDSLTSSDEDENDLPENDGNEQYIHREL